jgi:hypothetical protein
MVVCVHRVVVCGVDRVVVCHLDRRVDPQMTQRDPKLQWIHPHRGIRLALPHHPHLPTEP